MKNTILLSHAIEVYNKVKTLNNFSSLDINAKINLKTITNDLVGVDIKFLVIMFDYKQLITILYNKLKIEGFEI